MTTNDDPNVNKILVQYDLKISIQFKKLRDSYTRIILLDILLEYLKEVGGLAHMAH